MTRLIFTGLFMGVLSFLSAQETTLEDRYYNANGFRVNAKAESSFYYKIEDSTAYYVVSKFDSKSDKLIGKFGCSAIDPKYIKEGYAKFYNKEGILTSEGNYLNNEQTGRWMTYYPSGKPKEEAIYGAENKKAYVQLWSEEGPSLTRSSGSSFQFTDDRLTKLYFEVEDSVLTVHSTIDIKNMDTVYLVVHENASYSGGMEGFYKDLSRKMVYPQKAIRQDIEGKVYVGFYVNKDGTLSDIKTIKGIGFGCDEEAEKALRSMPNKWVPGVVHGKAVKQKLVIPVFFKLQ